MNNFWRFLDLPLTNCEIELDLSRSKECIISEISITPRTVADLNADPSVQARAAIQITVETFQINNTKLHVPVVTLSINNNIKLLETIKQGFNFLGQL